MATSQLEWAKQIAAALDSSRLAYKRLDAVRAVLTKMITELTPPPPPPNNAPTVSILGPVSGITTDTLIYKATVTDIDGDSVTVSWTVNNNNAGLGTTLSLVTPQPGKYTVQAKADDGKGGSALSNVIDVSVASPPPPPPPPVSTRGLLTGWNPGPKAADYSAVVGANPVRVKTTDDLAAIVPTKPAGTVFLLDSGRHVLSGEIRPRANMKFIGNADTVLDGEGRTFKAFVADWAYTPQKVLLANFTLTNVKQPSSQTGNGTKLKAETCAIQALDTVQYESPYQPGRDPSGGWTLENLKVTKCTGGAFLGSGGVARDCQFIENDQIGFKMWGDSITITGCDLSRNNVPGLYDTWYEAGGMKSWKGNNHLIKNCKANGNTGSGIWLDYTGSGAVIENCEAWDNTSSGIALETSIAPVLRKSIVRGNLGDMLTNGKDWFNGGVNLYATPGALIEDNTIEGGVIFQSQDRGLTGWGAHPNGADAATAGEKQTGTYDAVVQNNTITTGPGQWSGERVMVQTDFPPYATITGARARQIVANMKWINNTWNDGATFCYADLSKVDTNIWSATERHYTDIAGWRALGRS